MLKIKVPHHIVPYIQRSKEDFKISTFCTGGPGGQKQNHTNSGVRITDIKTGLSSEGREFRSQKQNRSAAFLKLVEMIVEYYKNLYPKPVQVPVNKVVRNYNYDRNQVIDHRSDKEFNLKDVLNGDLGQIHSSYKIDLLD